MVLVIFLEDDLEHIVEEGILFVCLCDLSARLQVGGLVFDPVWNGLMDELLAEGNQRFTAGSVELVFKVAESLARDLHVTLHEVAADPRMEFIEVGPKDYVILTLKE